ncbi:MAG TPA: hypothetical protein VHT72_12125 [Puia sp.]|nr:hypothetical protein [Puia sp.]
MKKVLLTLFAVMGVTSLIVGSTVTNAKFHSTEHTVLTIQDTVSKPDPMVHEGFTAEFW